MTGEDFLHHELHLPSFKSLLVDCRWVDFDRDQNIGTGTAFLVEQMGSLYLITNRHVVTGLNTESGEVLSTHSVVPTHVDVRYHLDGSSPYALPPVSNPLSALRTEVVRHELYDSAGNPRWIEHPLGSAVDVVALEVTFDQSFAPWTYELDPQPLDTSETVPVVRPGSRLAIVGFPFGRSTSDVLPIWVHGFVASVPELDHDGLPRFLIDSRTRPGQSGSPVIFHNNAGAEDVLGSDGDTYAGVVVPGMFMGVYSGRMSADSDLGFVWRREVVREILDQNEDRPSRERLGLARANN